MNCPNCGVPLMGGMKICPKCKWDTSSSDGGAAFRECKQKLEEQAAEEARLAAMTLEERNELQRKENAATLENVKRRYKPVVYGAILHVDGARGRAIDIFPNKCVISTGVTIGSLLTSNATDGEKTIYYGDCIGLQFKQAGLTLGYLQLETAAATMNNSQSNFFNENTFTYDVSSISNADMCVIVDYIKEQVEKIKVRLYGNGLE